MRRDVFQGIADPTRRSIIGLLASQAMTPNALSEHFDSTRQAISKHLRILMRIDKAGTSGQRNLLPTGTEQDERD
jgi:DNA-binding transcriptional ArsR family regulator